MPSLFKKANHKSHPRPFRLKQKTKEAPMKPQLIFTLFFQVIWYLIVFNVNSSLSFILTVVFCVLGFLFLMKNKIPLSHWRLILLSGLVLEIASAQIGLLQYKNPFILGLSLELISLWLCLSFCIAYCMAYLRNIKNKYLIPITYIGVFASYKIAEQQDLMQFKDYGIYIFTALWIAIFLWQIKKSFITDTKVALTS